MMSTIGGVGSGYASILSWRKARIPPMNVMTNRARTSTRCLIENAISAFKRMGPDQTQCRIENERSYRDRLPARRPRDVSFRPPGPRTSYLWSQQFRPAAGLAAPGSDRHG